jgi:hypothetical protein
MTETQRGEACLVITLDDLLARQPIEVMEDLARLHFSRSALRRRRLDGRDALIRRLACDLIAHGAKPDGKPLARAVRRALDRYESDAWPREHENAEPTDPHRALLWGILTLSAGCKIPHVPQLVRILAGFRVPATLVGPSNVTPPAVAERQSARDTRAARNARIGEERDRAQG